MSHHTLSSTAKRMYWLGRYLERTENTARLVSVHANLLMDLPKRLPLGWRPVVDCCISYVFVKFHDFVEKFSIFRWTY